MPIQKITSEELEALRTDQPHIYEEVLKLRDFKARLWNALVWYESDSKKFHGRLAALAQDLATEAKAELLEREPETTQGTQMDHVAKRMQANGWWNCHSF